MVGIVGGPGTGKTEQLKLYVKENVNTVVVAQMR